MLSPSFVRRLLFSLFISIRWQVATTSGWEHCADERLLLSDPVIYISSFGSDFYKRARASGSNSTVISKNSSGSKRLIVYHEDDLVDIPRVCRVDMRNFDWLEHELNSPESGLKKYFSIATYHDPMRNPATAGKIEHGHILMLKVAAINHAVNTAMEGQIVLWSDTDTSFRVPLPNSSIEWLLQRDVTYIPFYLKDHSKNPWEGLDMNNETDWTRALRMESWKVESGTMAFTVNERTRNLTKKALEMYRGGLYELAKSCFGGNPKCRQERVGSNVYSNDVYVWALLLQSDIHKDEFFSVGLRHGWFAFKGLELWGDKQYQYGNFWWPLYFSPATRNDSLVAKFHIGRHVFHHFAMHQNGALSMQHKHGSASSDNWRKIPNPGDRRKSLLAFLGTF